MLNYEIEDDLIKYVKRVKNLIQESEFNYKEHHNIDITFCAGLAIRDKYNTFQDTLDKADQLLYKAKESGRNKIILDNGTIL